MANKIPENPRNRTAPDLYNGIETYNTPVEMFELMKKKTKAPQVLDTIKVKCMDMAKDSLSAFFDMFNMSIEVETDFINFKETETPSFVIDDEGAVSRSGDTFTIDWEKVEGWEKGTDSFYFRPNDVIAVFDDKGNKEMGVIKAVDKSANTFVAKSRNGASWEVGDSNLTIDVTGSDWAKGSCMPEGLLERRKVKNRVLKLITLKESAQQVGGKKWGFCDDKGKTISWYDQEGFDAEKRLNRKVTKTLLLDTESTSDSGAYIDGHYGTSGLFDTCEKNSFVHDGYISDESHLETITTYYSEKLGFREKEFYVHCDAKQYRLLEKLAIKLIKNKGVDVTVTLDNIGGQMAKFGFNSFEKDGFTFHFKKWGMKSGDSMFNHNNVSEALPKGIIIPSGLIDTEINGVPRKVPYAFKVWQNQKMIRPGMIRKYFEGAGHNNGSCEYSKVNLSTTVGLATPCPEALVLIK